jgi:hypothetical protein
LIVDPIPPAPSSTQSGWFLRHEQSNWLAQAWDAV